jgi:hypothetical protein
MTRIRWIIFGVVVAVLVITVFVFFGDKLITKAEEWASTWTVVLSLAVIIVLIVASKDYAEFLNYFVIALCGGALGWVIGILASPSTAEEAQTFGEYKTAIVGFLSGFALSKMNDFWNMLKAGNPPMLLSPGVLNRVLLFFGVMAMLIAQQYNVRQAGIGQVIVAAAVAPADLEVAHTMGTVTVRPGAKLTLKGAASFPEMDVDWRRGSDNTDFAKAVQFKDGVVTVPDATALAKVKSGDKTSFIAASRWNKSRTGTLIVILDKSDTGASQKPDQSQPAPPAGGAAPKTEPAKTEAPKPPAGGAEQKSIAK